MSGRPRASGMGHRAACGAMVLLLALAPASARDEMAGVTEAIRACLDPRLSLGALRITLTEGEWREATPSAEDGCLRNGGLRVVIRKSSLPDCEGSSPVWNDDALYLRLVGQPHDALLEVYGVPHGSGVLRGCDLALTRLAPIDPRAFGLPSAPYDARPGRAFYRNSDPYGADLRLYTSAEPFGGVMQVIATSVNLTEDATP